MVDRDSGQQAALSDLVRAGHRNLRGNAIETAAIDRAAHDEMVRAPTMIGTIAVRLQSPAKIGGSEGRDLVGNTQFHGGFVKGIHREIELPHQIILIANKIIMQVEPAHADHEHLTPCTQRLTRRDQAGDDLQLFCQTVAAGGRTERRGQRNRLQCSGQYAFRVDRTFGDAVIFGLQNIVAGLGHQSPQRGAAGTRPKEGVFDAIDSKRSAGRHLICQGRLTGKEHRVTRGRNTGEQRIGIARHRKVAHASAPAVGCTFGLGRLPGRLLVIVRKQLGRTRVRGLVRTVILRQGQRRNERPDIQQRRHFPLIEQGL